MGIAAFVVDSFAGRGLRPPVYADAPKATHFAAHLLDAYLALQLIATHPRIDGQRVAVMGFSRGGDVAMNAVFERFRAGALGAAPDRFAAYIPFYPYCNFRHVSKSLAAAPMLMLLAGADEMNEPAPCERLAAWLKERNVPVKVIVYPNVHHGFDRLQPVTLDRAFAGIRKCEAEYDLDSLAIRRLDTGALLAREAIGDWIPRMPAQRRALRRRRQGPRGFDRRSTGVLVRCVRTVMHAALASNARSAALPRDLERNRREARETENGGRARRDIDHPTFDERSAVVDADQHGFPVTFVGDMHLCSKGKRAMRGGQPLRVGSLAARGLISLVCIDGSETCDWLRLRKSDRNNVDSESASRGRHR